MIQKIGKGMSRGLFRESFIILEENSQESIKFGRSVLNYSVLTKYEELIL